MSEVFILTYIIFVIVAILIIRLFGAWMLRINEVIKYQKQILDELRRIRGNT
jgi:flagellar biosynthesis protein FliQ